MTKRHTDSSDKPPWSATTLFRLVCVPLIPNAGRYLNYKPGILVLLWLQSSIRDPVFRQSSNIPSFPCTLCPCDSGIRLGKEYSPNPLVAAWDQGVLPSTKPQFLRGTGDLRRFYLLKGSGSRNREETGLHKPEALVCRVRARFLQTDH